MGRVTELLVRSGYIAGLLAFAYIALNAHTPAGLVIGAVVLLALIPFVAKRLADHSRS